MPSRPGSCCSPRIPPAELVELAVSSRSALGYDYFWLADERFFREVYTSSALCALRTRPHPASGRASPTRTRAIPR